MSETQLDAFLKEDEPAPVAEPTPQPTPEPAPKPENDDDEPIPVAAEGEPAVPRRALEDERHKRQNYAVQAAKFEAERDMLAKQLEELKKAPPPQPAAPQVVDTPNLPNPVDDPAGYYQAVTQAAEFKAWQANMHMHLNASERSLRAKVGKDAVEALKDEVKPEFDRNPALHREFLNQDDPYGWLHERVQAVRLMREVNMDPAAYEAKLRAKWEAETKQAPPHVSPVAGLPPSLATVRSAAGRSAPADTGDMSLDDLVKDIRAAAVRRK